jgi:hypothetical protein
MFSQQRRLFPPELIPWQRLSITPILQKLNQQYQFNQFGPQVTANGDFGSLVGTGGEFHVGDSIAPLLRLQVEANALDFQIEGDTASANLFFEGFVKLLNEVSGAELLNPDSAITTVHQTIVIARLDVPFERMVAPAFRDFVHQVALPKFQVPDGSAEVILGNLIWQVRYATESTKFVYAPKPFSIEPRAGSSPEDFLYHTQSPTTSDEHLALIEAFEKALS